MNVLSMSTVHYGRHSLKGNDSYREFILELSLSFSGKEITRKI